MTALAALLVGAAPLPYRPVRPVLTPARYRLLLAPVRDCGEFARRFAALPDARPLLRGLFTGGLPAQAPDETGPEFLRRGVQRLFVRLGDPSRLHSAVPLGAAGHYDAARQVLTVTFPVPYEATLESRGRGPAEDGLRAVTELRGLFEFPPGALPERLTFPMRAADAARFTGGGGRLHILSLFQDYGTDQASDAGRSTHYRLVRLQPKCALVSNGAVPLGGWGYDGWTAAAGGG